jgi:hypothetical protein
MDFGENVVLSENPRESGVFFMYIYAMESHWEQIVLNQVPTLVQLAYSGVQRLNERNKLESSKFTYRKCSNGAKCGLMQ